MALNPGYLPFFPLCFSAFSYYFTEARREQALKPDLSLLCGRGFWPVNTVLRASNTVTQPLLHSNGFKVYILIGGDCRCL